MSTNERIIDLLKESGVPTHKWASTLSEVTGVSYQGVRRWIKGEVKNITYDNIDKLARHFNVSVERLMCIDDLPRESQLDQRLRLITASLSEPQKRFVIETIENLKNIVPDTK
jgi:transcriptional regulator with XRE-family HTH domain